MGDQGRRRYGCPGSMAVDQRDVAEMEVAVAFANESTAASV
jgi:hypothetical protein